MRCVRIVTVVLALVGCGGDERTPRFRSTGTLLLYRVDDDDRAGWATELELLRSRALLDDVGRVFADRGQAVPLDQVRVSARHRRGTRVVEVTVAHDDGLVAREVCNLLVRTYLERRLDGQLAGQHELERELDEQRANLMVDGREDPVRLKAYERTVERLRELQLTALPRQNDAQVLDTCTTPR